MTVKSIEEQISAIREVTERAAASPEAALDFLRRAGIVGIAKRSSKKSAAKSIVYQAVASHRYTFAAENQDPTRKDTTVTACVIAAEPGKRKAK